MIASIFGRFSRISLIFHEARCASEFASASLHLLPRIWHFRAIFGIARLVVVLVVWASAVQGDLLQAALADTGPLAKILDKEHDFGRVMQGQKVVHEFAIQNSGDADLVLQRIAPSCGCTAAAVSSSTIKPGASEKVRVTFDTAGMYGSKTKTVSVVTNAREYPEVTLTMRGSVVRGVTATPDRLVFGEISPGASPATRTQEVAIAVAEGMDWEVARVISGSKFVNIIPLGVQGGAERYSVAIQPDAPKGEMRERLIVEFKDPAHAAVNIPVIATIMGDLRLNPATVSFGIISGTEPIERRIKYENSSSIPVVISGVTSSHPAVTAAMLDLDVGKRGVVVIKVDPTKVKGDIKATVELTTNHPEQKTLAISVYGVQPPK